MGHRRAEKIANDRKYPPGLLFVSVVPRVLDDLEPRIRDAIGENRLMLRRKEEVLAAAKNECRH